MSGGSFDYAYRMVEQFADDLAVKIDGHDKKNEYGETPYAFEKDTLEALRKIERLARYTSRLMMEAEWLYSGDTSEESFMKRL